MEESPRTRRKKAWFKLGVEALQTAHPDAPAVYCCPLCVRGFGLDDLTFEDVPPKSVGGRPLVLTCTTCNNRSGTSLDPHARSGQDAQEFAAGTRQVRVNLSLGRHRIAADMERTPTGFLFLGVEKHSHPAHHKALFKRLDEIVDTGERDWGFTVVIRNTHDPWLEHLSWLRAAYLVAFAALGYTYVLRPELTELREQLASPREKRLPYFVAKAQAEDVQTRRLVFVFEPHELRGLLVQFGNRLVFLPDFIAGPDFFTAFKINQKSAVKNFRGIEVPWPTKPQFSLDFDPDDIVRYLPPGLFGG